MTAAASKLDPLLADWQASLPGDGDQEWRRQWSILAARAASLVEDWPIAAAMVRARLLRILGSHGLTFRSQFGADDAVRDALERAIADASQTIDAEGLPRAELEWRLAHDAIVYGDGFAVRFLDDEAPGWQTRWRVIVPWRVSPPPDRAQDPKLTGGIETDDRGRPVALWVSAGDAMAPRWQRIPWRADDGTPNVIHATGLRLPGARRGVSEFTPLIVTARMLQQVDLAFVVLKRVQASHPLVIRVEDLQAAREQYRGTRLSNMLVAKDHDVQFSELRFEGADYREFVDACLRSLCAAWALPWELVLGEHSAKSGAASRSLWQQHYLAADREQAKHAAEISRVIDRSIFAELRARGGLPPGLAGIPLEELAAGDYLGPPQVYPDPVKEAEWAKAMLEIGMSPSTVFARIGEDYRAEVAQRRRDAAFAGEGEGVG